MIPKQLLKNSIKKTMEETKQTTDGVHVEINQENTQTLTQKNNEPDCVTPSPKNQRHELESDRLRTEEELCSEECKEESKNERKVSIQESA